MAADPSFAAVPIQPTSLAMHRSLIATPLRMARIDAAGRGGSQLRMERRGIVRGRACGCMRRCCLGGAILAVVRQPLAASPAIGAAATIAVSLEPAAS
jgi:hypothetical protein